MTKRRLFLSFFLILSKLFFAQNQLSFINFSEKEGLNEKYIYSITQDKNNTLWIGTGGGLYRFDGHYFTKVNSSIDKPGRQISNVLQNVYCDKSVEFGCQVLMHFKFLILIPIASKLLIIQIRPLAK